MIAVGTRLISWGLPCTWYKITTSTKRDGARAKRATSGRIKNSTGVGSCEIRYQLPAALCCRPDMENSVVTLCRYPRKAQCESRRHAPRQGQNICLPLKYTSLSYYCTSIKLYYTSSTLSNRRHHFRTVYVDAANRCRPLFIKRSVGPPRE